MKCISLVHKITNPSAWNLFLYQQDLAVKHNIPVTILPTYTILQNADWVKKIDSYQKRYRHEVGIFIRLDTSLRNIVYKDKYGQKDSFHFLPYQDKIRIIDLVMEKFYASFGLYPETIASLQLDSDTLGW